MVWVGVACATVVTLVSVLSVPVAAAQLTDQVPHSAPWLRRVN